MKKIGSTPDGGSIVEMSEFEVKALVRLFVIAEGTDDPSRFGFHSETYLSGRNDFSGAIGSGRRVRREQVSLQPVAGDP